MLEFFEYTATDKAVWDAFVLAHPQGSVHQVSAWRDFQTKIPGRENVYGFGVRENGQILGTTWCVQMDTGRFGKFWFYSARGPVIDPQNHPEATEFLLSQVTQVLKDRGGIFWRLDPYWSPDLWDKIPTTNYKAPTQTYQPTDTLEIDLTLPEDDILAQMKQRGRRGIKTATKAGIYIETIPHGQFSGTDLEDWWSLSQDTTGRDGFSGHEKAYYQHLLSSLPEQAVLFFATLNGQRLAAAISTFCGDKAIYYFGASTSDREQNKLKAPTLLQWEMMKYGKNKNCKTYDFLGIAPEDEPNHPYAGITQFKNGFGGYRQTYHPGQEVTLNPFWYGVYRALKRLKS